MQKKTLFEQASTVASAIALTAAIGAVISVLSHSITDLKDSAEFSDRNTEVLFDRIKKQLSEAQAQKVELQRIRQQLQAAKKSQQKMDSVTFIGKSSNDTYLLRKVNNLQQQVDYLQSNRRIDSIDNRLESLEQALGDSPSKSLAIPLLKRDIDGLKESETRDIEALKAQIAAVYDQNKWFIGLMLTLSLSMISLVVINILPKIDFPKRGKDSEKSGPKES